MNTKPNIITIGFAKQLFNTQSREYERACRYAQETGEFHTIIFTKRKEQYSFIQDKNLCIHSTNSIFRPMMLWDAFWIAKRIIKQSAGSWIISAQDPLEVGWLSWVVAKVTGARLHIQVHGDYLSSKNWAGYSPLRHGRLILARILLTHVSAIRVVSKRIKQSLVAHGVSEEKITVLPIRPELEEFLKMNSIVRENPPYTFLYIGRLAPEKDILRIVEAFSIVHRKHRETLLRIVGSGTEKKRIEQLIQKLGCEDSVTMVPWTNAVPREMAEADVFLLASHHEAYALTLVEAMAIGLPIVTTDVGCVGEVMVEGEHGLVVRESGVEPYARAVERMLLDSDLRKACSEKEKIAARKLAITTFEEYAHAWVTSISGAGEQV